MKCRICGHNNKCIHDDSWWDRKVGRDYAEMCYSYYIKGTSLVSDYEFDCFLSSMKVLRPEMNELWNMVGYDKELVEKWTKE